MLVLSLVIATLAPEPAAAPSGRRQAAKVDDKERVVCRSIVRTGTRHAIRTCLTAREWWVIDEHAMEMIREVQRKPIVN